MEKIVKQIGENIWWIRQESTWAFKTWLNLWWLVYPWLFLQLKTVEIPKQVHIYKLGKTSQNRYHFKIWTVKIGSLGSELNLRSAVNSRFKKDLKLQINLHKAFFYGWPVF